VRRTLAGLTAAIVLAIASLGFAIVAYQQRQAALEATATAETATKTANEQRKLAEQATQTAKIERDSAVKATQAANMQRDRALLQESRSLAMLAQQVSKAGDQPTAMLLALEALPDPGFGGARPLSCDAAAALHQAWLRNREIAPLEQYDILSALFSADGTHLAPGRATKRLGCGTCARRRRASFPSGNTKTPSTSRRSAPTGHG
jgi:hypothetical protein